MTSRETAKINLGLVVLIVLGIVFTYFLIQPCANIGCTIKISILVVCAVLAFVTAFAMGRTASRSQAKRKSKSTNLPMKGIVGDFRTEYEGDPQSSKEIWRFDLLADAAAGGTRSRTEVKMTGWWFQGELVNGEAVEITEWENRGDGITAHEVSVLNNGIVTGRVRAGDTLRGIVSDFKVEERDTRSRGGVRGSKSITSKAWKFRLQRHDVHGNTLLPGVVEMVGTWFSGDIKDGDEVEIAQDWQPGEELSTDQALNVSTGTTVEAHR